MLLGRVLSGNAYHHPPANILTLEGSPAYQYAPIRRTLLFIEQSLSAGLRWTVFEPSTPALWARVAVTADNFLHTLFVQGRLQGKTPQAAYFVQCDATTMSQADLDNGRLVCLIGVAPVRPAEFVIIRIGLFTRWPPT